MGCRINAGGHARNDGNPALGQAAAEVVGDAQCLRGGVAAANYGHGRAVQQFDVAADEQHRRRGDAFGQHGGEVFVAQQQQAAVFLFRPFFGGFGGLFGFSAPVCPCFLRGFAHQYLPYGCGIRLPRGGGRAEMADKLQEGFRADVRHQCQPQPVMAFLFSNHAVSPLCIIIAAVMAYFAAIGNGKGRLKNGFCPFQTAPFICLLRLRLRVRSKSRRFGATTVWHTVRFAPEVRHECLVRRCGLCPKR